MEYSQDTQVEKSPLRKDDGDNFIIFPIIVVVATIELLRSVFWSSLYNHNLLVYIPGFNVVAVLLSLLSKSKRFAIIASLVLSFGLGIVAHFSYGVLIVNSEIPTFGELLETFLIGSLLWAFSPLLTLLISSSLLVFFAYESIHCSSIRERDRYWMICWTWFAITSLSLPMSISSFLNCATNFWLIPIPIITCFLGVVIAIYYRRKTKRHSERPLHVNKNQDVQSNVKPKNVLPHGKSNEDSCSVDNFQVTQVANSSFAIKDERVSSVFPLILVVSIIEVLRFVFWSDLYDARVSIYFPGLNVVAMLIAMLNKSKKIAVTLSIALSFFFGSIVYFAYNAITSTSEFVPFFELFATLLFGSLISAFTALIHLTLFSAFLVLIVYEPSHDSSIHGRDKYWMICWIWFAVTSLFLPMNWTSIGNCSRNFWLSAIPVTACLLGTIAAIYYQKKMKRRDE